jgi:Ca-activated chloride channel family protein
VKFTDPWWLAAAAIACIVLPWMWRRHDVRQHAALAGFVSAHLRHQLTRSISVPRRRARRGLFLAALACLCVSLAGPLVGYRWEQISRRGNEIVFAIDTSRSMSTPDVKPDRLTRAKLAIADFANGLDGDALGIVAFAGDAFLVCPITLDYGAFHDSLGAIDTHTIPRGGTNIARAIQVAQAALNRRPGTDKILVLVTDGEDLEGSALQAARAAAGDGVKIYAVGVGTAAGDLIPIPAEQGGGFVKDETGSFVKSRLDEAALKAIATATGGIYVPLGAQGEGVEAIIKALFGSVAKHDLAFRQRKVYIERYQWPLAAALALLLASLLIGTRRGRVRRPAAAVAAALALLAVWPVHENRAADVDAAAARPDPAMPVLQFNSGTAAYRAGRFPQAAQEFRQSIRGAPSADAQRLAGQQDAYYNLGNALYRAGQKSEAGAPAQTLEKWNEALKAYDTALQMRADDADSKYNRDFVKRKIDELQKKNQKNPQQKPQPNQGAGQPPSSGQPPPGGQHPPSGQPPPAGQPPPRSAGQPPPAAAAGEPPRDAPGGAPPDERHLPGQMSREEARELLDSAKSDERHAPTAPLALRDAEQPPDKPYRNW